MTTIYIYCIAGIFRKEAIAIRVHDGCGLDITRPRMFYHELLQIQASTKILPPPPENTRYTVYTDTNPITIPCSLARAGNNCGILISILLVLCLHGYKHFYWIIPNINLLYYQRVR